MSETATASWSYYLLMGSLPPLPPDFEVNRLPISGPRLEERLNHLPADERETTNALRELFFWDRQRADIADEEVLSRFHTFLSRTDQPLVRDLARFRMDIRWLIACLRRRRLNLGPPARSSHWDLIVRRSWDDAALGLGAQFPWLAKLERHLSDGELDAANHLILSVMYRHYSRLAAQRQFSFEAVILYVARWDVLDRWVSRDPEVGRQRFEQLVMEAIGDHQRLF